VAQNDSRSVEDLKRDAERSRAEFTQTVHQLRSTVSDAAADLRGRFAPETIKADIGDYVRTRGERMVEAAQQNPLQAAAVGAIAAYPVAAIMRRIPMPIMLIGAGLFLMSSQTGRNVAQKAGERAGDLAERGRQMATDLRDKSSDAVAGMAEQAQSVGASIRGAVSDASDAVRGMAHDIAHSAVDAAAQTGKTVSGTARQFTDTAQHSASDAMDSLRNPGASFDGVVRWARENPLMAAAAGMAAGAFVASALPVTRIETRIAETATGDLRRRLGDAAAQGASAVDQITERASQQGLTPQAIADATRDFGERALKIAEAAAGAALAHDDSQIPAGG
jgi:hypothetical protein